VFSSIHSFLCLPFIPFYSFYSVTFPFTLREVFFSPPYYPWHCADPLFRRPSAGDLPSFLLSPNFFLGYRLPFCWNVAPDSPLFDSLPLYFCRSSRTTVKDFSSVVAVPSPSPALHSPRLFLLFQTQSPSLLLHFLPLFSLFQLLCRSGVPPFCLSNTVPRFPPPFLPLRCSPLLPFMSLFSLRRFQSFILCSLSPMAVPACARQKCCCYLLCSFPPSENILPPLPPFVYLFSAPLHLGGGVFYPQNLPPPFLLFVPLWLSSPFLRIRPLVGGIVLWDQLPLYTHHV